MFLNITNSLFCSATEKRAMALSSRGESRDLRYHRSSDINNKVKLRSPQRTLQSWCSVEEKHNRNKPCMLEWTYLPPLCAPSTLLSNCVQQRIYKEELGVRERFLFLQLLSVYFLWLQHTHFVVTVIQIDIRVLPVGCCRPAPQMSAGIVQT